MIPGSQFTVSLLNCIAPCRGLPQAWQAWLSPDSLSAAEEAVQALMSLVCCTGHGVSLLYMTSCLWSFHWQALSAANTALGSDPGTAA